MNKWYIYGAIGLTIGCVSLLLYFLFNDKQSDYENLYQEIEKKYESNEVLVMFKTDASENDIQNIIKKVNGTVLDSMPEIKNYRIKIENKNPKDILNTIEILRSESLVEFADLNEIASLIDDDPSNEIPSRHPSFEKALNIYQGDALIYQTNKYSFLYPSDLTTVTEEKIADPKNKKGIAYSHEYLKNDAFQNKVNAFIEKDKSDGYIFNNVIDTYERDGLTITRYEVTKNGKTMFRGFIQAQDTFFQFRPNDKISIDELSLILDSFVVTTALNPA